MQSKYKSTEMYAYLNQKLITNTIIRKPTVLTSYFICQRYYLETNNLTDGN